MGILLVEVGRLDRGTREEMAAEIPSSLCNPYCFGARQSVSVSLTATACDLLSGLAVGLPPPHKCGFRLPLTFPCPLTLIGLLSLRRSIPTGFEPRPQFVQRATQRESREGKHELRSSIPAPEDPPGPRGVKQTAGGGGPLTTDPPAALFLRHGTGGQAELAPARLAHSVDALPCAPPL